MINYGLSITRMQTFSKSREKYLLHSIKERGGYEWEKEGKRVKKLTLIHSFAKGHPGC